MNKHIGSSFDDYLKEEGILEEVEIEALRKLDKIRRDMKRFRELSEELLKEENFNK